VNEEIEHGICRSSSLETGRFTGAYRPDQGQGKYWKNTVRGFGGIKEWMSHSIGAEDRA